MAQQSLESCATLGRFREHFNRISDLLSSTKGLVFRQREEDFSRDRVLTAEIVVLLLLYMVADAGKRGYRLLLSAFWDDCTDHGIPLKSDIPVKKQAFAAARNKLKPAIVRHLVHETADEFDRLHGKDFLFRGFRLFAIDGCKMTLNRSDQLFDAFGAPKGGHNPQALVSALYNVCSGKIHGLTVAPQDASERDEAEKLLPRLRAGDILTADRGYPSFRIFDQMRKRGIHFVFRVPKANTFTEVVDFIASGRREGRVTLRPPEGYEESAEPMVLRIAVFRAPGMEPLVLLTDLLKDKLTRRDLKAIYKLRWKVEDLYGVIQGDYLGQKQFHSKKPEGIEQEILALALFINLVRTVTTLAAKREGTPRDRICEKEAVLTTKAYLTRLLLLANSEEFDRFLDRCIRRIGRCTTKPRPGRSYPRVSYKPSPRWGPSGKRRGARGLS